MRQEMKSLVKMNAKMLLVSLANRMTGKGVPELESALGDEFLVDYVRVYDMGACLR